MQKYTLPPMGNIKVITTYIGEQKDKAFFDEHPELFLSNPSQQAISKFIMEARSKPSGKQFSVLEVKEDGTMIAHINSSSL